MEKLSFLFLTVVGAAFGQILYGGDCPDVKVVQNFNTSNYLGTWYKSARYRSRFELGTSCNSANYSLGSNGTINILNEAIDVFNNETQIIEGTASYKGNETEGQFDVHFPSPAAETNYYILDTDYNSWAAVFSCQEIGVDFHWRYVWLLTRERVASEEVVNKTIAALEAQDIDRDYLMTVDQTNCEEI